MIQQIRYRVKVHPVDENGCRAHVYYDDAPWRSDVDRELGETGVGFSTHGDALETTRYWARIDAERLNPDPLERRNDEED